MTSMLSLNMIIKQAVTVAISAVGATNLANVFENKNKHKISTRSHAAIQTSITV